MDPLDPDPDHVKFLQAAALGVPTVASELIPYECIESGKNGFLVHNGKPEAWMEPLDALITDASLRQRTGAEARKTLLERYDMRNNAKNWIYAYEQIMNLK